MTDRQLPSGPSANSPVADPVVFRRAQRALRRSIAANAAPPRRREGKLRRLTYLDRRDKAARNDWRRRKLARQLAPGWGPVE